MNYKEEDKKYIEAGGRVVYYDFTEKEIARVVKTNVRELENSDWRMLIQMLYPTNMIGSGFFQPILIFRIGKNVETYDGHKGIVIKHFKPTGRSMTVHIQEADGRIWFCPENEIVYVR